MLRLLSLPLALLAGCAGTTDAPTGPLDGGHWHIDLLDRAQLVVVQSAEGGPFPETRHTVPAGWAVATPRVETRAFQELLPSWNVAVEPGASFTVDLRVHDGPLASPWLRIGEWGAVHPDAGVTRFEGGRVAIDIFEGTRDFDAFELCVKSFGGAVRIESLHAALSSAGSTLADRGDTLGAPCAPAFPSRSQRVEDPGIAGRICSPTSVAMVLEAKGVDLTTAEVAAALYDPRHDIYGNWGRAVQGAFVLGVRGYLTRISTWTQVRHHLEAGEPLVISIAYEPGELSGAPIERTSGHLIVICGLDGVGGVVCRDPAAPDANTVPRVYAADELEDIWLGGNGVAYVLTTRVE